MNIDEITQSVICQLEGWGDYVYHTICVGGKEYKGMRNCLDRINKIFCIPWYRILDLGCNLGGMIWPYRLYYSETIGIDNNKQIIEFCKNLSQIYDVQNKTKFLVHDLNKIDELDYLGEFDVIFLLALTQHLVKWKDVIRWAHEHSTLLVIEYNGQPDQLKEYIEYTKTLRKGMDYLGEFSNRYLYMCYNPIKFDLNNKTYYTYKLREGPNVVTYYSAKENAVIKLYKNKAYLSEVEWCNKLICAPDIYFVDEKRDIVIQEFCGMFLTYYNVPDDYAIQISNIKKELAEKKCNGEDVEAYVKDGKIKIIDLGACTQSEILSGRIDMDVEYARFRKIQYMRGQKITVHNNDKL